MNRSSEKHTRLSDKIFAVGLIVGTGLLGWLCLTMISHNAKLDVLIDQSQNTQKFIEVYGPKVIKNETILESLTLRDG